MAEDSPNLLRDTLVEYLERIIKGQDDKINRLIIEIQRIKKSLERCEADRSRILKWLDTLDKIARRKNKRLQELGEDVSDVPDIPYLRPH